MNTLYNYIIFISSYSPETQPTSLSKNESACVFTSIDISNIILLTRKPISKKKMQSILISHNDVKNFYVNSEATYYEFDEVIDLSNHPVEFFYNNHFQVEYLFSSSVFLFTSYENKSFTNPLFSQCLLSFAKKITTFINDFIPNTYSVTIISFLIYNKTVYDLLSKHSESNENTLEILNEINDNKTKTINELNCNENEINLFIKILFANGMEVYFINSANTYLKDKEEEEQDSPYKQMKDFLNDIVTISDKSKQDYFKIDKIEKMFIIACLDESEENLNKTILKLKTMHYLSKETKSNLTKSMRISGLDSIMCSNDEINNYNNNSLSNSFNPFVPMNSSVNKNLKNSLNIINTTNNLNNESIICPEVTLMQTTELGAQNDNNKLRPSEQFVGTLSKFGNENSMNEMLKMLEKIYESIEKRDNEEIEKLKEELNKVNNSKGEIENNLKKVKNELDLELENNFALNKKIQQKDNYIANLEKKINDLKEVNEKEIQKVKDDIVNSNYDNKDMKNKLKLYETKYQQLKANNETMKQRLDNIQNKLNMFSQLKAVKK